MLDASGAVGLRSFLGFLVSFSDNTLLRIPREVSHSTFQSLGSAGEIIMITGPGCRGDDLRPNGPRPR